MAWLDKVTPSIHILSVVVSLTQLYWITLSLPPLNVTFYRTEKA